MQRTTEAQHDDDWMTQLAAGNLDAAAVLFQRYRQALFNFYLRQGIDRELGEDLVQNTFERVIKYRQSYRRGMGFRSWVYQIARNVQADWQRQGRQWPRKELNGLELELPEPPSSTEREENYGLMEKALQQLPADQREILVLARLQRMKYVEIAECLGCSEGAVKLKVFRALQQLRSLYFKLEER